MMINKWFILFIIIIAVVAITIIINPHHHRRRRHHYHHHHHHHRHRHHYHHRHRHHHRHNHPMGCNDDSPFLFPFNKSMWVANKTPFHHLRTVTQRVISSGVMPRVQGRSAMSIISGISTFLVMWYGGFTHSEIDYSIVSCFFVIIIIILLII